MIRLRLDRHGRNVTAHCTVSGGFSLSAILLLFTTFTGSGRELLKDVIELLVASLR